MLIAFNFLSERKICDMLRIRIDISCPIIRASSGTLILFKKKNFHRRFKEVTQKFHARKLTNANLQKKKI